MKLKAVVVVLVVVTCSSKAYALTAMDIEARASVRINNGGCSGVVFAAGVDKAYGVSAAHCAASEGSQFTIHFSDGRQASARWLKVDRTKDLALFTLWSRDVLGVSPIRNGLPDGSFAARAIGYPSGDGPNIKDVTLKGASSAQGIPRNTFYIDSGLGWGGDSGGGVFVDGKLIGVTSHMSTQAVYDRNGPNGGASVLYCSKNEQLVEFIQSNESVMEASCRDNWCWTPRPNRPIDTRPLPRPDLDSDRDREQALQAVLDRLDGIDKQIDELNNQSVDTNMAIANLQNRLDELEKRVTGNGQNIGELTEKIASHDKSLDQITMLLGKMADRQDAVDKANASQDAAIIAIRGIVDELSARPQRVQILDPRGEVISDETYPPGSPIRLQFGKIVIKEDD